MMHPIQLGIREQMEVLTADGTCLGRVRDLSHPSKIRLSSVKGRPDSEIDATWIAWVDGSVYLKQTKDQVVAFWNDLRLDAAA